MPQAEPQGTPDRGCIGPPAYYTWYATLRCNMACPMCFQRSLRPGPAGDLTYDEARGMFDRVGALERINLIGGEVFVRNDACALLEYFDGRGVVTYVTTNGALLDRERLARLAALQRLLGVTVSMDAVGDDYSAIRGTRTRGARVLEIIDALCRFTTVRVNTVLVEENRGRLTPLIRTLAEAGVSQLKLQLRIAHSAAVVGATERMMRAWFDQPIRCLYPAEQRRWAPEALRRELDGARDAAERFGLPVRVFPEALEQHLGGYADESLWARRRLTCEGFGRIPRLKVMPNGDVILCEGLGFTLGNLRERSPEDLWASARRAAFEREVEAAGGLPICGRCCRVVVGPRRDRELAS